MTRRDLDNKHEWQPIETAPKVEGEWIFACVAGTKIPMVTGWDDDDGWFTINRVFKTWRPTHWMPMAVPPPR